MKTLYTIRHAKSSWQNLGQTDFERPLNDRGNKDAPNMAQRLLNKGISIELFVSSTANRAQQTCMHFCKAFGYDTHQILLFDRLYHAPGPVFYEIILQLPNQYHHAAIFAHNPGITDFVNSLVQSVRIDDMPTCGIFAIEANIDDWKDFSHAEKKFLFFDFPKSI